MELYTYDSEIGGCQVTVFATGTYFGFHQRFVKGSNVGTRPSVTIDAAGAGQQRAHCDAVNLVDPSAVLNHFQFSFTEPAPHDRSTVEGLLLLNWCK
jgi:hypothetical protein